MSYDAKLFDGLQIFTTVARLGSFTAAASETGHSTSHISKEISKLEERLGLRLLNRSTRKLSLTVEGKLYFQHGQQIIDDFSQVQQQLAGQQQQPSGTLRISLPSSFKRQRMQQLISEFVAAHPQLDLELEVSNRKVDMIAEGFDVVLRATHRLEDSSLVQRKVYQSYGITVAAPSYLKRHGTPQFPEQLVEHQTLAYSNLKQPKHWLFINRYGKETTVQVKPRLLTNSSDMELALAIAGQGIVRLPHFLAEDALARGELVEIFDDYHKAPIDVFLVYPSRKHLSAKVRAFIDFISEALAQD